MYIFWISQEKKKEEKKKKKQTLLSVTCYVTFVIATFEFR